MAKRSQCCKQLLLQMNQEVLERSERVPDADFADSYDDVSYSAKMGLLYLLYDLRQLRFHFERLVEYKTRHRYGVAMDQSTIGQPTQGISCGISSDTILKLLLACMNDAAAG